MSTVEEVAARLAALVDLLPTDTAGTLIDQLDRVVGLVDAVAEGSGSAALAGAAASFARARDAACELVRELHATAEDIQAYREVLGFHAATAATVQPVRSIAGPARGRPADPDSLLAALPVRRPGEKTRGLWVDEHGTRHDLLSGEHDSWYELAKKRALDRRMVPMGTLGIASHVEVKFAEFMRASGVTRASITVNKRPCPGSHGCHRLLPYFLPEGSELTVYGPGGFAHTYRGRGNQADG